MGIQAQIQKRQLFRMEIRNSEMLTGPQTTRRPCVTYTLDPTPTSSLSMHTTMEALCIWLRQLFVEHKPEPVRKSAKRIERMAVSVVDMPRHICNFFYQNLLKNI